MMKAHLLRVALRPLQSCFSKGNFTISAGCTSAAAEQRISLQLQWVQHDVYPCAWHNQLYWFLQLLFLFRVWRHYQWHERNGCDVIKEDHDKYVTQ